MPPEGPGGRCGDRSSVDEVVGGSFVVFVNRSATVGLGFGQLTSYVAEVLPEPHSRLAVETVVAHACNECSKYNMRANFRILTVACRRKIWGRERAHAPPPQKKRRRNREHFWGNYHVKFWHFRQWRN